MCIYLYMCIYVNMCEVCERYQCTKGTILCVAEQV